MLRVAAITGGRDNPSSRFRVRQYISPLVKYGIALQELIGPLAASPPVEKWLRPLWGAAALACGLPRVVNSWKYDACLLQRELINTLVTLEPLTRKPRILDVDDAIFVYRKGWAARRLARLSDVIICGNSYLAEWFGRWNRNTVIIPTAVDTDRYVPRSRANGSGAVVIGWIGVSENYRYLASIEGALSKVLGEYPQARLRIISDSPPMLRGLPPSRVEWLRWSGDAEVEQLQGIDVGIMPLDDTPWSRGKCSYKMLQYMACGLPVVVSPVGMNSEVLSLGECGLGATNESQWVDQLLTLLKSSDLRVRLGAVGRQVVKSRFSIDAVAPELARCLLGNTSKTPLGRSVDRDLSTGLSPRPPEASCSPQ